MSDSHKPILQENMMYKRFENKNRLDKEQKVKLLQEYNKYYEEIVKSEGIEKLNVKIPRKIFDDVLDKIGSLIVEESIKMSKSGEVKLFLDNNPLPESLQGLLPDEFRAFSLLLNSLKQWVSAESGATDRFLLGGTARETCREASKICIVTGENLGNDAELHHPLRDGRPPILLSKEGHIFIENQVGIPDDPIWSKIKSLRKDRNMSWVQLREGCNAILGHITDYRSGAKSFANTIIRETGLDAEKIIQLLDSESIG